MALKQRCERSKKKKKRGRDKSFETGNDRNTAKKGKEGRKGKIWRERKRESDNENDTE